MASLLKAFQRTSSRFVGFFASRLLTKALAALVVMQFNLPPSSKLVSPSFLHYLGFRHVLKTKKPVTFVTSFVNWLGPTSEN
jgi:hypothetical protein